MNKHIIISGKVQGVGFRHYIYKYARSFNLHGWVRNMPDGNVEAFFEGEDKNVEDMLEHCRKGPAGSYVTNIKEVQSYKEKHHFDEFKIIH